VVVFQSTIILVSFFLLKIKIDKYILKRSIALIPLLLFITIVNIMHGSGKILFSIGPFYFIKQGLIKGVFYSVLVLDLFLMSYILTEGFDEIITIAVLKSFRLFKNKEDRKKSDEIDFFILIYYVLKLFKICYSNIPIFFKIIKKKVKETFKNRFILFFEDSLKKSQEEIRIVKEVNMPKVKHSI